VEAENCGAEADIQRENGIAERCPFDIVSNMLKPPKPERISLTEQITAELRRRIVSGQLAEGAVLRQERLAGELGVSRIPLREAIRHLESEGLVASELHKGTVVTRLTPGELEELFGIRTLLETWLFAAAIPRMTDLDFDRCEALIEEANRTGTISNWADLNWRFHEALYRASGTRMALRLLRSVHDNAVRYVSLQLEVMRDVERELADHQVLLAYARLRDVDRGVDALRRHIARVSRTLMASLSAGSVVSLKEIA
jgi:DNA-binding GntR family transcriptional regulator